MLISFKEEWSMREVQVNQNITIGQVEDDFVQNNIVTEINDGKISRRYQLEANEVESY